VKRGREVRIATAGALLAAGLALSGCGSLPDLDSFRPLAPTSMFRGYTVTSFRDKPLAPITAEDLVDSEGRCAGMAVAADSGGEPVAPPDAGIPAISSAVALEMTECDVVRRTGVPQQVDVGSAGGERVTTLTYIGGARPGIYRFAGGRLKSMERGAEATPTAAKPAKRPPKPKRTAS
jgi:hypothetical protein